MAFIYNDEDNIPMSDELLDINGHNPTVYTSYSEMKAVEKAVPFTDPGNGCWNCMLYDPSKCACTKNWNNLDSSYYNPDEDDREPDEYCKDHELDPDAIWEDFFGGNDA